MNMSNTIGLLDVAMGKGKRPFPKTASKASIIEEMGNGKMDNINTTNDGMLLDISFGKRYVCLMV